MSTSHQYVIEEQRRAALIALLLLIPAPSIGAAMVTMIAPGKVGQGFMFASKVWTLALPVAWLILVDRQRIRWPRLRLEGMGLALLSGLVMGALIIGAYYLIARHWIDVEAARVQISRAGFGTVGAYLGISVYICTVNALLEEYVWRWFVFRKCEVLWGGKMAVVVAALFFTFHHIWPLLAYFDWRVALLANAGIFLGGAIWSWFYLRYRSIWPGYLSHLIADIAVLAVGWLILFG